MMDEKLGYKDTAAGILLLQYINNFEGVGKEYIKELFELCSEFGIHGTDLIMFSECIMALTNKYADMAEEESNE